MKVVQREQQLKSQVTGPSGSGQCRCPSLTIPCSSSGAKHDWLPEMEHNLDFGCEGYSFQSKRKGQALSKTHWGRIT